MQVIVVTIVNGYEKVFSITQQQEGVGETASEIDKQSLSERTRQVSVHNRHQLCGKVQFP
jgi:hypothetical protein